MCDSDLVSYTQYTCAAPSIGIALLLSHPWTTRIQHLEQMSDVYSQQKTDLSTTRICNSWPRLTTTNQSASELYQTILQWAFSDEPREQRSVEYGNLFCFLPLPDVFTGFPIHIHGTFQLTDNRRSLWMALNDTGLYT